ncbi:polymeric immunoglobulin receptor-like [Brachyhypopomus gauderio]|uniref:polymeric immunoglobulin receptor-like n=1 Tax=Brachyhypopomus gauderio TaxID=698409 RepID=UPI004042BFA7
MDSVVLFVFLLCISVCVCVCVCLSADSESMRTLKHVAVKSGESVTIPCFYNKSYKLNKKYWCHGYSWSSCTIVSYANTYGSTSVIDHPTHNMFTVELNRLNTDHSGWYWCAAEIGDQSVLDDKDYLYLTVSAAPAVSVLGSRVSGEEGSSVSVQCLYSAAYQNKQKQWCRSTDWSCYKVGRTYTSQNSVVWIREWIGSFTVEMTGLKKNDAGWYWCSVGDVQVPVHLTVTDPSPKDPSPPAVSVLGSRVSGEEGSSVSVQCLYSAAYQNKQKQWCRSTDWSCYIVGRTYTSQNSAVWIREGIRSFNVVMTGLKKSDAGWYWCSVGDVQVPVHLTVTNALTVTPSENLINKITSIRKMMTQTTPGTISIIEL